MEGLIAIRPHPNSPILQNSPMLQIRPHRKFIHIAKFIHVANSPMFSIDHNGRANCPYTGEGELQFAPTRALSERWQILYANSITGMA